jgi:hypothetical protein
MTKGINNMQDTVSTPATRPPSRPAGSRNKRTLFVKSLFTEDDDKVKAIVETAIQRAIYSDADFAKLVLARIAPEPKGRLVQFDKPPLKSLRDISEAIAAVATAISEGRITIEEGEKMASLLNKYAQPVIEEADLEARILLLEQERR